MALPYANRHIEPNRESATLFAAHHFVTCYQKAVDHHGFFTVALSGGSTPSAVYQMLSKPPFSDLIMWDKVHLFWSDERATSPSSSESNYHMAMESGFKDMPIPPSQIHRMVAEEDLELNAKRYEELLHLTLFKGAFDLILLGMGDDGHTASLFPLTKGILCTDRQVIANYIPQKNCWRMTLTFPCINQAENTVFYVLGASKAFMVEQVFHSSNVFPCQQVGSRLHPALWIMDQAAAAAL
ncbi:6-phosphogluconolactonase [Rhabdochlamydiaceae symbiont of Dictyostelium giganteum]|uniref:6-phosphogluconolactonase n=1 Tax=Rhabdochlamydiaceae symbiont of Dictyostelium giganteum TaxID=3342349 RepID=UPI00384B8A43